MAKYMIIPDSYQRVRVPSDATPEQLQLCEMRVRWLRDHPSKPYPEELKHAMIKMYLVQPSQKKWAQGVIEGPRPKRRKVEVGEERQEEYLIQPNEPTLVRALSPVHLQETIRIKQEPQQNHRPIMEFIPLGEEASLSVVAPQPVPVPPTVDEVKTNAELVPSYTMEDMLACNSKVPVDLHCRHLSRTEWEKINWLEVRDDQDKGYVVQVRMQYKSGLLESLGIVQLREIMMHYILRNSLRSGLGIKEILAVTEFDLPSWIRREHMTISNGQIVVSPDSIVENGAPRLVHKLGDSKH